MTARQKSLLRWLDQNADQLPTEYDVRFIAAKELFASPAECAWLAREWARGRPLMIDESAAPAGTYAGTGSGPQKPTEEEEPMPEETQPAPTTAAVAKRPVAPELDGLARVGTWLAAAEKRNPDQNDRGAAAALRLYVAREIGLSPLAGLKIGVTEKGEIILPASLYRDLAAARGYRVVRVETTDEVCTAALVKLDTGEEVGRVTFTIEHAKRAGLVRAGSGYEKYPARMLWHRASKWVVEDFVPGLGFALSEDEAQEIANEPVFDFDAEEILTEDEVPV